MKPRRYSSEGIILASRRYSEGDRILTAFSKNYGKLSLIAKGVRKLKSRKRGSLEMFSLVKFSAASGKNLDVVTEVELIDTFEVVGGDLKKVSVAYFFVETVDKLTKEEEKNEELFSLLLNFLRKLKKDEGLKSLRKDFILKVLTLLGYWPRGKEMKDHDKVLEEVAERGFSTIRVGKSISS